MNSLGIYFGPRLIKMVECRGRKIIKTAEIHHSTIAAGELEEKVPLEVKTIEFVALLKDELRRNKIVAKEASLALSGRDLIIRTFEIPMIPREEIESAVNFEAKKYIPFKVEELIADFQLKFDKSSRTNTVFFMGLKKETLDRYVAIMHQLGIRIIAVEYSAFSIIRCLRLSGLSAKGNIGILSVDVTGEDEVNFTVLENGFPLFSRDISLTRGPESLARLRETGPLEALEKLKTELHVSLDYYNSKFPTKTLKKIFVISEQANRSELEAMIKESNLPAQSLNTDVYLEKPAPFSLCFLKAYSACLATTMRLPLKVNLLAAREKLRALKERVLPKEKVFRLKDLRLDFRILFLGLLFIGGTFGYGVQQMKPLRRELVDVLAQRKVVASVNARASQDELTKIAVLNKNRLESLESLINGQIYLTEIFNVISQDLPEGLWFTRLSFNKKEGGRAEFVLEGRVNLGDGDKEFDAVNNLLSNLQNNPDFVKYLRQITIGFLNRQTSVELPYSYTQFSISCSSYFSD
ncbi:MAG: hypothetical protein AMJ95_09305 [Omnitrophica WOR_2 bacterium SM23_72]|nr:MAG: hypothetical protein AMJ95_09305 [Omnitrophica WOR_2 bacterium SM23_72]